MTFSGVYTAYANTLASSRREKPDPTPGFNAHALIKAHTTTNFH